MRFSVSVDHHLPGFTLAVDIACDARVLALVGPSGSGKTTLLNMLAGLIQPMCGRIAFDDAVVLDTLRGVFQPVHRRRIGYVFQDGRLFPHLTVAQNLRYGRWFAATRPDAGWERDIVALLGIGGLLARRTGGLSGGERQRVALGRALLTGPNLLLMDEPLAALDEARRGDLMGLIETIRDASGVPIVYVSHNAAEVSRLADQVVTLRQGAVVDG